ncbi:MAG: glycosyltransferase family 4 protein [Desulfobulbaceae bacterium]|nr:glycosyltransferase family 4 protein [Desulfobulbaceae bacterium]
MAGICKSNSLCILMLSPQYRPLVGGYERAAERLSMALAARGTRVVVVTERRDTSWPGVEHRDGYEIRRLPCWYRRRVHLATSLLSFAWFLLWHGRKFDVWHVHQYGLHAALAVGLAGLLRRPVVLKLTSSAGMGINKILGYGLSGRIIKSLHRRVNACIALTAETREEAIRFGIPAHRVRLVPNSIDAHQFRPSSPEARVIARQMLGLNCERLVLFIGRLAPEKNPLGLIDAWAIIAPEQRSGALLVLVGDGEEEEKLAAKIKANNLTGSVLLAGRRHDIERWCQAADMYVMASHHEGLSNTMIEALASGLPVAATRVSGSSILEEQPAGIVVDVGDMEQLSLAIVQILNDDGMRGQLAVNARRTFEAHFSLDSLIPRLMTIYKQLPDLIDESEAGR